MNKVTLKEIAKDLHNIVVPSTLWGLHVDPELKYIALLHIKVENLMKLFVDKGILLYYDELNQKIKPVFLVHNKILDINILDNCLECISDISSLLAAFNNVILCENSNTDKFDDCLMYTENAELFCSHCKASNPLCNDKNQDYEFLSYESNCDINQSEIVAFSNSKGSVDCLSNDQSEINCLNDLKLNSKTCLNQTDALNVNGEVHENNQKPFVCHICNKLSNHKSSHDKHMLTHSKYKPNLCNVCGKTFCHGYRMEDHMLTHTLEKQHECFICKKKFAKKYNLKLHESTHSGDRPFVCSSCGKTYTTSSNLSTHIKSCHTGKKPHHCGVCKMSFVHPYMLKVHMRKHTGEKPFKCSICEKTFAKNIHLKVHTRMHTGERPHICSECGRGFTTTGNLTSHKRMHTKHSS